MKAIDRAKKHFASYDIKKITVDQWTDENGAPLVIYVKPFNVKDRDKMIRISEQYGRTIETNVRCLIEFAKDENGQPYFTLEDLHDLMYNADPYIIGAVVDEMVELETHEDIKKKLKQMRTLRPN